MIRLTLTLIFIFIFSFSIFGASVEVYVNAGGAVTVDGTTYGAGSAGGDGSAATPYNLIATALGDCSDADWDTIYLICDDTQTVLVEHSLDENDWVTRLTIQGIGNYKPIWTANDNTKDIIEIGSDNAMDSLYIYNIQGGDTYSIEYKNFINNIKKFNNIKIENCIGIGFYNSFFNSLNGDDISNIEIFNNSFKSTNVAADYWAALNIQPGESDYTIINIYNNISEVTNGAAFTIGPNAPGGGSYQGTFYNNICKNSNFGLSLTLRQQANIYIDNNCWDSNTIDIYDYYATSSLADSKGANGYTGNSYLLNSDTLGYDTVPNGLFSNLTPDTLISGGTGTYSQIGLSYEAQGQNNILAEYNNDTKAYVFVNSQMPDDTIAYTLNTYTTDTLSAEILNSDNMTDTKAASIMSNSVFTDTERVLILSNDNMLDTTSASIMSNSVFTDTERIELFSNSSFDTSKANSVMYNNSMEDSWNYYYTLILLDTSTILTINGNSATAQDTITITDTNYINVTVENIKGASEHRIFIYDVTDFSAPADTIIITGVNQTEGTSSELSYENTYHLTGRSYVAEAYRQ